MLASLKNISEIKSGKLKTLKEEVWLKYLHLTNEKNVNLEQVESLEQMAENPVLRYVEKTLTCLNEIDTNEIDSCHIEIIEEVLKWSEVAKCGLPHVRKQWAEQGFQLSIHNIGSAQIYAEEKMKLPFEKREVKKEELIFILILTHGLVGQYIRGEIRYKQFIPLIDWIQFYQKTYQPNLNMRKLLYILNKCIIESVSTNTWMSVRSDVRKVIGWIVEGKKEKEYLLKERLWKLRSSSVANGEDFNTLYHLKFADERLLDGFTSFFKNTDLWYVESALQDFSFEEFIKIFLLIYQQTNPLLLKQISFEPFMKDIYYDYKGKKTVNLYKKRIIESYLKDLSIEELLKGKQSKNEHVQLDILSLDQLKEIVGVKFSYSKAGERLIEFCQEAEKSPLYERSIILLYDFFGFRKDSFDRLQNEQTYLSEMNSGQDHKKIISNYAVGEVFLDIGAGGGVMLDVLTEQHPKAKVIGIDISINVIDELNKKKVREGKVWDVKQADALELKQYFKEESVDTIVFSSILHEMYSYIPYNGSRFNPEVIQKALISSFEVLKPGGRIIIRDGIMTENKSDLRMIEFKDQNGMEFFKRYIKDFKGRTLNYEYQSNTKVVMPINDAMEFLYTYTWGEESYPHEVQEQFGYFTPVEFKNVIENTLGDKAKILKFEHYLQDGYEQFLKPKVSFMDERGQDAPLPDSTCFIVIEKLR